MTLQAFNQGLLKFIQESPTPFHATSNMAAILSANGFTRLEPEQAWQLTPGQGYFTVRNDSSLIAFVHGRAPLAESGIRMVGAHTDSPCLRLKPKPEMSRHGLRQLGVEVYGGVLLNPWFDRDLSLAGRVSYVDQSNSRQRCLIDFKRPLATIPSLAIHLDREANNQRKVNPQTDIVPVLGLDRSGNKDLTSLLREQISAEHSDEPARVLDYELSFYDTQAPTMIGYDKEFIASARLDNLLSCFLGVQAMLAAGSEVSSLLICNDHEEVGSQSASGACGPMLSDFLSRVMPDTETRQRCLEHSMLVSADNAHGVHPNFSDRHDNNHRPELNRGPVIKINANQRYASNSLTTGVFRHLAHEADIALQDFVTRTDLACGSTIGPLTASTVGVATLDVGVPTFAMHSIRELAGSEDAWSLYQLLLQFQALDRLFH